MIKKISLSVTVLILTLLIPLFSENSGKLPNGVSIYMLDNGMKILMIENPALPMAGVNVVVKTGSAYENFATSGMSHMLEHLLFNGTTSRTQKQLYDDTDMIGGYNNANTSEFYTNYMMVTPAENIEKGMEIQADMLFNSILPPEKFKKEKGIVLEEISKSLVDAREQKNRNIISILFKGHALSLPTLGTYSTIEHMTRDEVYAYYKKNYVPNNMILSIVGRFNTTEMLKKIKEIYGHAPAGNIDRTTFGDFKTGFEKLKNNNMNGRTFFRFYGGKDTLLSQFYDIKNNLNPVHTKVLEFILKEREKDLRDIVIKKFSDTVKDISMGLISNPVKSFIEIEMRLKSTDRTEELSSFMKDRFNNIRFEINRGFLSEKISKERTNFLKNIEKPHMFGIFNAYNFSLYGIESVLSSYSGEEFLKAAKDLKDLKTGTDPVAIFQYPFVKKRSAKISSEKIQMFRDKKRGKSLIVERNPNSNLLAIHFLFKHKAIFEKDFGKGASEILHYCFEKRLKSEENLKKSRAFGISMKVNDNPFFPMDDIYMNPDFGYIRVEGLSEHTGDIIAFLKNNLRNFLPTKAEFNYASMKIMRFKMMKMGKGKTSKSIFSKIVSDTLYNSVPKGTSVVTYENLVKFSKEYFSPSNLIISVVSPLKTDDVNEMFDDLFPASFNGKEPSPVLKTLKLPGKKVLIRKRGESNRDYIFWGFVKNIEKKDIPALTALSLALSDVITFDIREKRGMAYGISSGIRTVGGKALFHVNLGTRPGNDKTLVRVIPGFFTPKTVSTLTVKNLKRLVNKYLGRMMFRRLSSINRAYYLGYSLYFSGNIHQDSESLEKLKNVTLSDVKRVAKKYLKIENPVLITVK